MRVVPLTDHWPGISGERVGTGAPGAGGRDRTMVTGESDATAVEPGPGLMDTTLGNGTVVVAGTAMVVGVIPPPSSPDPIAKRFRTGALVVAAATPPVATRTTNPVARRTPRERARFSGFSRVACRPFWLIRAMTSSLRALNLTTKPWSARVCVFFITTLKSRPARPTPIQSDFELEAQPRLCLLRRHGITPSG